MNDQKTDKELNWTGSQLRSLLEFFHHRSRNDVELDYFEQPLFETEKTDERPFVGNHNQNK